MAIPYRDGHFPLSTRAHNAYGEFLFNSERMEDARIEYERSAAVDPTVKLTTDLATSIRHRKIAPW